MKKICCFFCFLLPLMVFSQTANFNLTKRSHLSFPVSNGDASDIWGYVDTAGNEYALIGLHNGTAIVDVTNPTNPVEVYYISGASSNWRDIKTWNKHAYITNEGGGGLAIVNLSSLPDTNGITVTHYLGSSYPFTTAHNLFIDSNGYAYVMGADYQIGGAIILNLVPNPEAPVEAGLYNDYYLHDCYIRNDTLWGCAIYQGIFVVLDITNKTNIITLGDHNTPGATTHNCWLSDDGKYLFTTDEITSGVIASYNVTNMSNIYQVGQIQSNPGSGAIPHNTFFLNKYLITSYYRDGVVIFDASDPANMVEVGHYDTSPAYSGDGFNGCWGVYPFLPSGNIIAADIENGLYVLSPTYKRAAFIQGNITDFNTTFSLSNVKIEFLNDSIKDSTNLAGYYKTGTPDSGYFDIVYSKTGYVPDTVKNVFLNHGTDSTINIQLKPTLGIKVFPDIQNQLYCFPNPLSNTLNIKLKKGNIANISIYDISGKKVFFKKIKDKNTVTLKVKFPKGNYLLQVKTDKGIILKKKLIKISD